MKKLAYLFLPALLIGCGEAEETTDDQVQEEVVETIEEDEGEKIIASPRVQVEADVNGLAVSVDYGSPRVKERVIWGDLVPYDEVWRAGANAATAITFGSDATLGGENIAAGTYALFMVPHAEGAWDIILNEEWSQEEHGVWGAYDYKAEKDVLKITADPEWSENNVEEMKFTIQDGNLIFSWEKAILKIAVASADPA